MSTPILVPSELDETIHRNPPGIGPLPWFIGGVLLLLLGAVGFALALVGRVGAFQLQTMTTLPILGGLGLIVTAWSKARTPREVGVGPLGVRVESRRATRIHAWDRIGWSTVQTAPLSYRKQLTLFDPDGRVIARLGQDLSDFDGLVEQVAARIAARPDDTAERLRRSKARKQAAGLAVGGVLALALAGAVAWMTREQIRADRRLAAEGVAGIGRVEGHFLAPNGITPRLVYRITTRDGRTATRNAEMLRPAWDRLHEGDAVPVLYVPDEPSISRLAAGEAPDDDEFKNPIVGYGLPALVGLMGLFFLGTAALTFSGWDVNWDSKTSKLSIKRFGAGR